MYYVYMYMLLSGNQEVMSSSPARAMDAPNLKLKHR